MAKKIIRNNQTDLFYLKGDGFTEADASKATTFPSYDDAENFIELAKDLGAVDLLIENAPGERDVPQEVVLRRRPAPAAPAPVAPAPRPVVNPVVQAARPAPVVARGALEAEAGDQNEADDADGELIQNDDGHSWGIKYIRADGKVSPSKRTFKTRDQARVHARRAVARYEHKGAQFRKLRTIPVNSWINPKTGRTNPPLGKGREGILDKKRVAREAAARR
jgi:hypothetical protein